MNRLTSLLAAALALLTASAALAQTGGVTIGANQAANASAALDIISSSKGALLPRLTAAQRLGIGTPASGLIVFQTDAPTSGTGAGTLTGFWFNSGTGAVPAWQRLADSRDVSYSAAGLTVGPGVSTYATTSPTGTGIGNAYPFYGGQFEGSKFQVLVPAALLTAAGLTAGNLTEVALTIINKGSTKPYMSLAVQLGSTTTASLSSFYTGPLTTVYTAPAAGYSTVLGVNAWPFAAPYAWDGTSNLVVQLCYNNPLNYISGNGNDFINCYSNAANGQRIYQVASGPDGCSLTGGTADNSVPAVRFRRAEGYVLPAAAGTAGQVLTQQADGTITFANAPWTQAGTNLYPTTLASNVGIGTTTPGQKLEVAGSVYTNSEGAGVIVDAGGSARVGLLKYGGREAGLWRTTGQDFEIGRVSNGATAITALPGSPSTFTTDLYVAADGKVGIGTTAPFSQLANTASNMNGSDNNGGSANSLAWSASQSGYVGLLYNGQTAAPGNGLAVKVAGTNVGTSVLDLSAGAAQGTLGTNLLNVRANGAVSIPGTLTVGTRLTTGPLTHSVQILAAPTAATTITITTALLRLTNNGNGTNGIVTLGTTGVQEGQQVLVNNLDPESVEVTNATGTNLILSQFMTARLVYVGGFWTREY